MERLINTILNFIDNEIDEWTFDFPEEESEQRRKEAYEKLMQELKNDIPE